MAALLTFTGEVMKPDDIDKCHTLGDKSVIMEFKERELRDGVLRGRTRTVEEQTGRSQKYGNGKGHDPGKSLQAVCRDGLYMPFTKTQLRGRQHLVF